MNTENQKVTLQDGSLVTDDHREINPETGLQKGYKVLSKEELAKGFVRPLRHEYVHKTCGQSTGIRTEIAETFARDPKFYDGTFCGHCRSHFPLKDFRWSATKIDVGN